LYKKTLIAAVAIVCTSLTACADTTRDANLIQNNSVTGRKASKTPNPEVQKLVTQVAKEHGVDPALAHAVVQVESRYDCNAKNPKSTATGAMQVLRGTAREVGVTGNLRDCRTGLEAGMRYLKQAVTMHGEGCRAATAYNQGLYTRSRCNGYGRKVVALTARADRAQFAVNE
jgi:soluble lytic murein transglycosylase-like protein